MSELKAVDLFAGAGGGSVGLDQAGTEVVAAVDNDPDAVETYRNNPVDVEPLEADLTEVTFNDIADHYGFDIGEIDLVMGCPPCQNFSWLRDTVPWPEGEAKDELLKAFYERVKEADAEYVLFENVPGIASTDGGQYLKWLKDNMGELGYGMDVDVVNAADYGVPQRRKRTIGFFVKGRRNEEVEIPDPTHAPKEEARENGKQSWNTVRDAISDLPPLEAGEEWNEDPAHRASRHHESTIEILEAVPKDGGSRRDIQDEDLILECHKRLDEPNSAGNVYGRMAWDKPAPTLTTRCTTPSCGRFTHPEQNRGISYREAARLMTFPDFELPEKNGPAERVVGNAVPPRLIRSIISGILDLEKSSSVRL